MSPEQIHLTVIRDYIGLLTDGFQKKRITLKDVKDIEEKGVLLLDYLAEVLTDDLSETTLTVIQKQVYKLYHHFYGPLTELPLLSLRSGLKTFCDHRFIATPKKFVTIRKKYKPAFDKKGKPNPRKLTEQEQVFKDFIESKKVDLSLPIGKIEILLDRAGIDIPRSSLAYYLKKYRDK
jgi:hypothetical protein